MNMRICAAGAARRLALAVLGAAAVLALTPAARATIINVDAGGRVPTNPNRTQGASIFQFTVAGMVGNIMSVSVYLDIVHTWTEDLDISLVSPNATVVQLVLHRGSIPEFHNFDNTRLIDTAGMPISDGAPPFAGSFRPEAALNAFNGEAPNGNWSLIVNDDFLGDYGWLYRTGDARFEDRRARMDGTRLEIITPEPGALLMCVAMAGVVLRPRSGR